MSERKELIRRWVLHEMRCVVDDGHHTGPQAVMAEHFIQRSPDLYNHPANRQRFRDTPLSGSEVVAVLNDLIREGRLHFRELQCVGEGFVRTWLTIP